MSKFSNPRFYVLWLSFAQLKQYLEDIGIFGRWRQRPGDPLQQCDVGKAVINYWPSTRTLTIQNDEQERLTRILVAKGLPKIQHVRPKKPRRAPQPSRGFF